MEEINIDDLRVIKCRVNHILAGQSLIEYLSNRFSYHTQERWLKEIEDKRITVNGVYLLPNFILKCGDEISYLPEKIVEPQVDLNYKIIYEDDFLIVVDKSGNLPTHPAGIYMVNTLWFQLRKTHGAVFPVNRLDMETSGLLIFSKFAKIAGKLAQQRMEKYYYVLVHGKFENDIDANGYIYSDTQSQIRKKRKFSFDKSEIDETILKVETAHTYLEKVKSNEVYSLVKASLKTGRTHQIRATLYSLNYPVVGDKIYGLDETFFIKRKEDKLSEDDWKKLVLNRQALHSSYLKFNHVVEDKIMEFSSPLPVEIENLLK